jgi:hypothetical protein
VTDFPRGWTRTVAVTGAAASITIAAIPGVAHVLDAFFAQVVNTTAGGVSPLVRLSSSDGTFANMLLGQPTSPAPAAGNLDSGSASGSDLGLVAGQGASLTVAFDTGAAGLTEILLLQGHDI